MGVSLFWKGFVLFGFGYAVNLCFEDCNRGSQFGVFAPQFDNLGVEFAILLYKLIERTLEGFQIVTCTLPPARHPGYYAR